MLCNLLPTLFSCITVTLLTWAENHPCLFVSTAHLAAVQEVLWAHQEMEARAEAAFSGGHLLYKPLIGKVEFHFQEENHIHLRTSTIYCTALLLGRGSLKAFFFFFFKSSSTVRPYWWDITAWRWAVAFWIRLGHLCKRAHSSSS